MIVYCISSPAQSLQIQVINIYKARVEHTWFEPPPYCRDTVSRGTWGATERLVVQLVLVAEEPGGWCQVYCGVQAPTTALSTWLVVVVSSLSLCLTRQSAQLQLESGVPGLLTATVDTTGQSDGNLHSQSYSDSGEAKKSPVQSGCCTWWRLCLESSPVDGRCYPQRSGRITVTILQYSDSLSVTVSVTSSLGQQAGRG